MGKGERFSTFVSRSQSIKHESKHTAKLACCKHDWKLSCLKSDYRFGSRGSQRTHSLYWNRGAEVAAFQYNYLWRFISAETESWIFQVTEKLNSPIIWAIVFSYSATILLWIKRGKRDKSPVYGWVKTMRTNTVIQVNTFIKHILF